MITVSQKKKQLHAEHMIDLFKQDLKDEQFSDLKLSAFDGVKLSRQFNCHKFWLASKWPFLGQLMSSCETDLNDVIIFTEATESDLEDLINYSYLQVSTLPNDSLISQLR